MNCITNKRKENLQNIQKQLLSLSDSIQKVLDGESSMKQLAAELGWSSQTLNDTINDGVAVLLRRAKILNKEGVETLLRSSETPYERLVGDILGHNPKNGVIILDIAEEEVIREAIDSLNDIHRKIIKYRYGIVTGSPETLEATGKYFNVSRERIRLREEQALRKLRNPKVIHRLIPNYDIKILQIRDLDNAIRKEEENLEILLNIKSNELNSLKNNIETYKIPIIELGFRTRTYNALYRRGIETVADIVKLTITELSKIRNLGKLSLKEVIDKMNELGIELD